MPLRVKSLYSLDEDHLFLCIQVMSIACWGRKTDMWQNVAVKAQGKQSGSFCHTKLCDLKAMKDIFLVCFSELESYNLLLNPHPHYYEQKSITLKITAS